MARGQVRVASRVIGLSRERLSLKSASARPTNRGVSQEPFVSVALAAYNYGRFLADAIDSALDQEDYPLEAIEVIVVDDGSTDDTPEVAARYGDRIRYVRKENGGLLSTVNRGLAEARGDYITFLSADDVMLPPLVRREVDFLEANRHVGLVYADMRVIDRGGACLEPSFFRSWGITPPSGDLYGALLAQNYVSGGGSMVRASLKPRFHPIADHAAWEDWWVAIRVAEVAEIGVIDEPLYGYRQHGDNMNRGVTGVKRAELLRTEIPFRRHLLAEVEPGRTPLPRLADALGMLDRVLATVTGALGARPEELLPVDEAQHAAAAAATQAGQTALANGDLDTAACRFLNAVGHAPLLDEARSGFTAALAASTPRPALEAEHDPLECAHAFATLSFADELLARPALLRAWGENFGAEDDATLVILAPGAEPERLMIELSAAAEAAGIGDDADLLALPYARSEGVPRRLAARAAAVLSDRPPEPGFEALPHAGESGVALLRALADGVWADR